MNKGYQFIINLLAFAVIVGSIYLITQWAGTLDVSQVTITNTLDANVVLVVIAVLAGVILIRSAVRPRSKTNGINRVERGATYKRFVDYFYQGLPLDDGWHDLTAHMTLWAPDNVLKKYLQLVQLLEEKKDKALIERKAELVIFEIRRDWGFSNLGIITEDLVKTSKRFEKYIHDDLPSEISNPSKQVDDVDINDVLVATHMGHQSADLNGHQNDGEIT